jgi:uncharacterized protein (DUF58 family)
MLIERRAIMIGPLLWNWRTVVLSVRQLTIRRQLPEVVFAGQPFRVELQAGNQRRRLGSWMLVMEDRICPAADGKPRRRGQGREAAVVLPYLAPGRSSKASYQVTLPHRGLYELGPLRVSTRFPFGLVKASTRCSQVERVLVWPRLGRLAPRWVRLVDSIRLGRQPAPFRQGPIDGDYYGLREWRAGDSKRWIHWRTTAKLGELAVRQFEQLQNQDLAIILDLWLPEGASEAERMRVERAVSFAATLVDEAARRGGSRLTLGLAGTTVDRWSGRASHVFARRLMEVLAVAEPAADNGLARLLEGAAAELPPGARILTVSTRPSQLAGISNRPASSRRLRQQRALANVIWLDVDGPATDQVFQLDEA